MSIRNDGIPTEPGFYWCEREATRYTARSIDVVEVYRNEYGLFARGFDEDALEDMSKVWQQVKPYDVEEL